MGASAAAGGGITASTLLCLDTAAVDELDEDDVDVDEAATAAAAAAALLLLCRSGGQAQSRHRRRQSPQRGLISSHFFLRRLHMRHPVWTRRMRALGTSPFCDSAPSLALTELRGRHGRLRRTQRAQGKLPSQACLIWAQRWQTGRLSEPIWCWRAPLSRAGPGGAASGGGARGAVMYSRHVRTCTCALQVEGSRPCRRCWVVSDGWRRRRVVLVVLVGSVGRRFAVAGRDVQRRCRCRRSRCVPAVSRARCCGSWKGSQVDSSTRRLV